MTMMTASRRFSGVPTTYLADDGACIHPLTGQADPTLTDRNVAV
jgi:hypothetical protein